MKTIEEIITMFGGVEGLYVSIVRPEHRRQAGPLCSGPKSSSRRAYEGSLRHILRFRSHVIRIRCRSPISTA